MSMTWLTPPAILSSLGEFDLDPCAASTMPWKTAKTMYAPPQDGLALPWRDRVWLNPPYGREIGKWMARLSDHGEGTALVFSRTDTKWFFQRVWTKASALLFLRGRIQFHFPDGMRSPDCGGAPSVLAAYGRKDMDILASSGLNGAFVPLANGQQILVLMEYTWMEVISRLFRRSPQMDLDEVYEKLKGHPKAKRNKHWKAKIRQQLQRGQFSRISRGVYRLEAA